MTELWRTRCTATLKYFECVQEALDQTPAWWLERYSRRSTLDIAELMALLHPDIYRETPAYTRLVKNGSCPVRGARVFKATHMSIRPQCESMPLWLYRCTATWTHASSLSAVFRTDEEAEDLHQDHLFPYCFGGVTTIENRGLLCGLHNAIKAHDVHIWPWEKWGELGSGPKWMTDALARVNTIMIRLTPSLHH